MDTTYRNYELPWELSQAQDARFRKLLRHTLLAIIAFIFLALTGGFAVVVYLILWAVVPKAETSSDRLAMRGEPANVENISKIIEEELDHVSQKVSELGEELKSEFASKKKLSREHMTTPKTKMRGLPSGTISVRPLPKGFMF